MYLYLYRVPRSCQILERHFGHSQQGRKPLCVLPNGDTGPVRHVCSNGALLRGDRFFGHFAVGLLCVRRLFGEPGYVGPTVTDVFVRSCLATTATLSLPSSLGPGTRVCHDGSHGSPLAVERSSNRAGGRDHGSAAGHANAPYRSTAAETGQMAGQAATLAAVINHHHLDQYVRFF